MAETVKFGDDGYLETGGQPPQPSAERRPLSLQRSESKPAETTSRSPRTIQPQAAAVGRDEFTGALQPLQVKIPSDLIQSLKLHAIGTDKTMSDLVLDCLTSDVQITKAWVSSRRAA